MSAKVERLEQDIEDDDKGASLTAERALELALTNQQNIALTKGDLKTDINKEFVNTQVATQVQTLEQVNQEQYENLLDRIGVVPTLVGTTVVGGLTPTLNKIATNTRPQALVDAAASGVCQSTRPGGCMQTNVVDRLSNNIGDVVNAGGTAFAAANNALLLRMQGTLGAINNTVTTIKSITSTTLGVVTHAKHGLRAIQNFAETAWKVTRADKVMQGVSLAMTVHNGMMLSNNLLSTVSEATNMTFSALGIRDETDTPIDIGAAIKDKITGILQSILGAEGYAALRNRL